MKISEFRNEAGLEAIADIIEPLGEILGDKFFRNMVESGKANRMQMVAYVLKHHAKAIVAVLARLEGVDVKDYDKSVIGMTKDLLDVMNDEELKPFFELQGLKMDGEFFGSATENIGETETI